MTARSKYVNHLTDLTDEVLACHVYRHAWELLKVSHESPVGLEVWTVRLRCTRCGVRRNDQVEPGTYDLYDRHYGDYPDGYRTLEPATTANKRQEIIRRAVVRGGLR